MTARDRHSGGHHRPGLTRRVELGPARAGPYDEPFAATWWGREWIRAMEKHAPDPGRLARGRAYARDGYVAGATVAPGRIAAAVRGSRPRPYRAAVGLRELTGEEWDAFLDAVAAHPAHTAALLDRDMPPQLVEAAEAAGVRMLPGDDEPALQCSCPDRGGLCKHTAALCYVTARVLDDDPFLLLLLRGRTESELLEDLARRNAAQAVHTAHADHAAAEAVHKADAPGTAGNAAVADLPTVGARTVLATAERPPLPEPLLLPEAPGEGPALPDSPGPEATTSGEPDPLGPEALAFLAGDAAGRAHAFLAGSASSPLPRLAPWRDAVRMAATHPRLTGRGLVSRRFARLAAATGGTAEELARAAAAWRQGGEAGLAVLHEPWDPPAGGFDRGRSALAALGVRMAIDRNRLTAGSLQLRYGRDGRWYPYRADAGSGFWPEGPSAAEATQALGALTT